MSMSQTTAALDELSIVIPVFNALQETLDCVTSLLASDVGSCPIILMDDASDWGVQQQLNETFKDNKNVKIISHFRNRGYTRNISMGVELTSTDYVCILNSDTLLPKIWATPMVEKLQQNRQLAGIGPLTNAGSYQSIPLVVELDRSGFSENGGLGFDPKERETVARLVALLGQNRTVDVPILNGFCTIFRRSILDEIGGFDVASYPEGYGEENDLCIRMKAEGYRLCVDLSCFVHHQKSKSFGSVRKKKLSAKGSAMLATKFGSDLVPGFSRQLQSNVPLATMRAQMKLALDGAQSGLAAPKILKSKSKGIDVGPAATKNVGCVTLSGGTSYRITAQNIIESMTPEMNGDAIRVQTVNDGLNVTLPDGVDLTLFATAPIASALLALSLISIEQVVYVGEWLPADQGAAANGENDVYWPVSWQMPDVEKGMAFPRICLRG